MVDEPYETINHDEAEYDGTDPEAPFLRHHSVPPGDKKEPTKPGTTYQKYVSKTINGLFYFVGEARRLFSRAAFWSFLHSLILVVIATLAVVVYDSQLAEMRTANSNTDRQIILGMGQLAVAARNAKTAEDSSPDTHTLAESTRGAAQTASKNLALVQEQFRLDQRPYLAPEPRGVFPDPTKETKYLAYSTQTNEIGVAVDISNVGRSPAIEVLASHTEYKLGTKDKVRDEVSHYTPKYGGANPTIVLAGSSLTPHSDELPIPPLAFSMFQSGFIEIYVVGGVRYRDIFNPRLKEVYETTYCYRLLPSGLPFGNCELPSPTFGTSIK